VQSQNVFIGRIDQPQPEEFDIFLGKSAVAWHQLVQWLIEKESVTEQEWNSFSATYGCPLKNEEKEENNHLPRAINTVLHRRDRIGTARHDSSARGATCLLRP
jgi:hypothetical protein